VLQSFDLSAENPAPYHAAIRSVAADRDGLRILVGTQGAELYEIVADSGNTTQLIQAHCNEELWGLAPHPTDSDVYATAGDDCTVRVWSISQRKCLRKTSLDSPARALAWSPDGTLLAVGLGSDAKSRKSGAFVVLNSDSLTAVHEGREGKEWIRDVKFSPDGQTLAIGSRDNVIYLHSVQDNYSLRCRCDKHTSDITHFDFAADGSAIRSNSGQGELLYYNANTGDHDPNSGDYKDTAWQTETCTLDWAVQGTDGSDVNALHRSADGSLLVTATEFGKVQLYNYPCVSKGNNTNEGKGHSSHVTNVRFSADDTTVVTTGGSDKAVFVWNLC
jgi:WD40 repeat protein